MNAENFTVIYEKKNLPKKILNYGLILSVTGLIFIITAFINDTLRASYLSMVTFVFIVSIPLGAMFMVAIEYVTGAVWSVPFRRVAEFFGAVLFLAPLFLIPVIFRFHSIFNWAQQDSVAQSSYWNETAFLFRLFVMFIVWLTFYLIIIHNSLKQDITGEASLSKRNTAISAWFLVFLGVSLTVAAIDWLISYELNLYSTITGIYYFTGTVIAGLSAWALASISLNENGYLIKGIRPDNYYGFGALLFAFVIFWAFIAFSMFLLVWYTNMPEETNWFLLHGEGSWLYFVMGLIIVQFLIPFILLLPQKAKMDAKRLKVAAVLLLFAHFADIYWFVMPQNDKSGYKFCALDFAFPIFTVGAVMFVFYFVARNKNLVPIKDPKLMQSMKYRI